MLLFFCPQHVLSNVGPAVFLLLIVTSLMVTVSAQSTPPVAVAVAVPVQGEYMVNVTALPDDCEFLLDEDRTSFTTRLVATVSAESVCATQQELDELAKALAEVYNTLNVISSDETTSDVGYCDPFSRFITGVTVSSDLLGTLTTATAVRHRHLHLQRHVQRPISPTDGDSELQVQVLQRKLSSSDYLPLQSTTTVNQYVRGGEKAASTGTTHTHTHTHTQMHMRALQQHNTSNSNNNNTSNDTISSSDDDLVFQDNLRTLDSSNVDLMFEIDGTCSGCSNDDGLFDDVVGRRRLNLNNRERRSSPTAFLAQSHDSPIHARMVQLRQTQTEGVDTIQPFTCSCADDATEDRGTSVEEFLALFVEIVEGSTLFSVQVENIVEVTPSVCSPETELEDDATVLTTMETITIDVEQIFGGVAVTTDDIEKAFVCSYNWLATRIFCDPSFTALKSATFVDVLFSNDISTFIFDVNATCVGCSGIFATRPNEDDETVDEVGLIDISSRQQFVAEFNSRFTNSQGRCFCPVDGPSRQPTQTELEQVFGVCVFRPLSLPPLEICQRIDLYEVSTESPTEQPPTRSPTTTPTTPTPPDTCDYEECGSECCNAFEVCDNSSTGDTTFCRPCAFEECCDQSCTGDEFCSDNPSCQIGECVECDTDDDCASDEECDCSDGTCQCAEECCNDDDCDKFEVCNLATHTCRDCVFDECCSKPCEEDEFCSDNPQCGIGNCVEECDSEDDCSADFECNCKTGLCECAHECCSDDDCGKFEVCNTSTNKCRDCAFEECCNKECSGGTFCSDNPACGIGNCVECDSEDDCGYGSTCNCNTGMCTGM